MKSIRNIRLRVRKLGLQERLPKDEIRSESCDLLKKNIFNEPKFEGIGTNQS